MKKINIAVIVLVVLALAYNQYANYKRFHPPANYLIKANENIDPNYFDQSTVKNYYGAVEKANAYAIEKWSEGRINVQHPSRNNEKTQAAVSQYRQLIADANYYEAKLLQSAEWKKQGLSNEQIKSAVNKGVDGKDIGDVLDEYEYKKTVSDFLNHQNLQRGMENQSVMICQKMLVAQGFEIPIDGIFNSITEDAVKQFQDKNALMKNGIIDPITFSKLSR